MRYMFGVAVSLVSRILSTWVSFVYMRLGMIPTWPEWEDVGKTMLLSFYKTFPDVFLIIDATKLHVETPTSLSQ